jgi:beta-lactamase class A
MNKKKAIILSVLVILVIANLILLYLYLNSKVICEDNLKFHLVSPLIAWQEVEDFLVEQKSLKISYSDMKPQLIGIINNSANHGIYGVYFEDLTTGAWIGINERDKFMPLSLTKLPLLVAVMKKAERGELDLEQKVTIQKEFLDSQSGTLYKNGVGSTFTVKELLTHMINESDNTAFYALLNVTSVEEFETARMAMGLPPLNDPGLISPKEYSNMLRSLYFSTYLRRFFSEVALNLMMSTNFDSELPSGVPKNVQVAHKVGFSEKRGFYHDCGIIYDDYPYILCVMSTNSTQEESNRVISSISKAVYEYKHK